MRVWSPGQLGAFLEHVINDRLYTAWLLLASTGMRRGEVAGLRWVDVDLDAGRVSPRRPRVVVNFEVVVSEPKDAKGRRSLALDPATVAALREHRRRQLEERLAVGPGWVDSGPGVHLAGRPATAPGAVSRWFEQARPRRWPPTDPAARRSPQLRDGGAGRGHPGQGELRRPKRSADKPLTSGPRAARRRREVKGEPAGQEEGDRGDSNPRPSGPQPDALTN
jgi:integrase